MNVELIASTPDPERLIERCARISHGSKVSETLGETRLFIMRKLVDRHEESPIEHASATFFISGISRVCSHQIVRHRLASYTQRSSRYTSVTEKDPGDRYVYPLGRDVYTVQQHDMFDKAIDSAEKAYLELVASGVPKEDARFILPQAETTSLYMTANFREWRHFLKLRTSKHAQWEVRQVANHILFHFRLIAPSCFYDILPILEDDGGK